MPPGSCLDTIPPSALTRVVVYAQTRLHDSTTRAFQPAADNFAQSVAEHARGLLGARGDTLPRGEPVVGWRGLGAGLTVTAHRDGRVTWVAPPSQSSATAAALLARAAEAARADGEMLFWPDGLAADSLSFTVALAWPVVRKSGTAMPPLLRAATPVFSLEVPWEAPALAKLERPAIPRYPADLQNRRIGGSVLLQFLVDTTGTPVMSTVRDLRPAATQASLNEDERSAHPRFVDEARKALERGRFDPARIGGCVVPQLVQMPFVFRMPGQ
jgi:outer membrane biosynthesis protein TonB